MKDKKNQLITNELKEKILETITHTPDTFLNRLNNVINHYKIEETFLSELAEQAAKLGRFSIVQDINSISPRSIIKDSLAEQLLTCPHGKDIEKLHIDQFFCVKKLYPRPSVHSLSNIVKLILAAKFNRNETLNKDKVQIPVVVLNNDLKELNKFIKHIKQQKEQAFKAIFTVGDFHWVTCYVEKDENECLRLFILDAKGNDSLLGISNQFFAKFKEQEVKVYISNIKLQHGMNYCQDFAIDTLLHLLSHYQDIFKYIEDSKHILSVENISNTKHQVIQVLPPLFLIRTKQSLNKKREKPLEGGLYQLTENFYSKEEIETPFGKKDFWSSIKPHIKEDKNKRIEYKLEKIQQELVIKYLIKTPCDKFQREKEQFDLNSLFSLDTDNYEENPKENHKMH